MTATEHDLYAARYEVQFLRDRAKLREDRRARCMAQARRFTDQGLRKAARAMIQAARNANTSARYFERWARRTEQGQPWSDVIRDPIGVLRLAADSRELVSR